MTTIYPSTSFTFLPILAGETTTYTPAAYKASIFSFAVPLLSALQLRIDIIVLSIIMIHFLDIYFY
ncbi:MAG: hypothetical protein P9M11_01875 [Candidatus Tenebribacter burtonii]|nr:hypothetical protein [Candidatus Tenebribacter burtonii]